MSSEPLIETSGSGTVESRGRTDLFGALAAAIRRATTGDRAALARLQPEALQPNELAALSRALIAAGLTPESWRAETWPRWALIAQGMALAGHSPGRLGEQLARAAVAESRVTRLLTARGDAFRQLLPRLLRLLANKGVAPNWRELGTLVLNEPGGSPSNAKDAEAVRLQIAGSYFAHLAKTAKH